MNKQLIMNLATGAFFGLVFTTVFMVAPAYASAATLSLSPTTGSHAAESTFEVKILLDTKSVATNGTDAIVRFDPNALQVVDSNASSSGTQIQPGSLYPQTSYNSVDNGAGKITFSGSKSGSSPGYNGSGTLATITFQAVKEATDSEVTLDFISGSTTDSNVIDSSSKDVLTAVTDAKFTITASESSTPEPSDSSGASGNSGTGGVGGSNDVGETGMNLNGYLLLTLFSLFAAAYFLTRKQPRHHR